MFDHDVRLQELAHWLSAQTHLQPDVAGLKPASSDASFRRYFRCGTGLAGHPSLILMDAPPPQEDVRPFIHVAQLLAAQGVTVPEVLAADTERGFLALSDLGNTTYLSVLNQANAKALYEDACTALIAFQHADTATLGLPAYDEQRLIAEMQLFIDWYVIKHRQATLTDAEAADLQRIFLLLARDATSQGQVLVHRDYHSRNLMVVDSQSPAQARGQSNPGILDFQDAVVGPITYDLVSLFRDAYIHWPEEQVLDWSIRYWEQARKAGLPVDADPSEFYRQFEFMGLQRHLKVLGIFARLYHRDGKEGYLKDLPLVMHYTRHVAQRFSVLKPLIRLLDRLDDVTPTVGYTF